MTENYFVIEVQLPSLNEYQNACRTHAQSGARFKKKVEEIITWAILKGKNSGTLRKVTDYPVQIEIEWHEKDKRRDVDNIKSAAKFILDAMTKCGVIKDDGRRYVSQIHDNVIDDKKAFVVVKILGSKIQQIKIQEDI